MHARARREFEGKDAVAEATRWGILSTYWLRIQVKLATKESVERGRVTEKI
jgi:hypothetical protein